MSQIMTTFVFFLVVIPPCAHNSWCTFSRQTYLQTFLLHTYTSWKGAHACGSHCIGSKTPLFYFIYCHIRVPCMIIQSWISTTIKPDTWLVRVVLWSRVLSHVMASLQVCHAHRRQQQWLQLANVASGASVASPQTCVGHPQYVCQPCHVASPSSCLNSLLHACLSLCFLSKYSRLCFNCSTKITFFKELLKSQLFGNQIVLNLFYLHVNHIYNEQISC